MNKTSLSSLTPQGVTMDTSFTKATERNNSLPQQHGGFQFVCDNDRCIAIVILISFIAIPGAIANAAVVIQVSRDRQLRSATFCALAALALADLIFIVSKYVTSVLFYYFYSGTSSLVYGFTLALESIATVSAASSAYHVVLLYAFRYYKLVYPLRCYLWITVTRIMIVSGCVWAVCTLFIAVYICLVYVMFDKYPLIGFVVNIVITIVMALVPLCIIVVLHFIKMIKLRKSVAATRIDVTRTMSRMVTVIVIIFIITTTPANVRDIVLLGVEAPTDNLFLIYQDVCRVLIFVNFAANPFIFLMFSGQFRQSIRWCCGTAGSPRMSFRPSISERATSFSM